MISCYHVRLSETIFRTTSLLTQGEWTDPMMVILQNLIEALRNELQQYGEMLALMDHQREVVRRKGSDDIADTISAINAQSATIQGARENRHSFQRQLSLSLKQPEDSTFAHLIPLIPVQYRPLVSALVQENNELLLRVLARAQQNQAQLRHSAELMQQFITTLSSETQILSVNGESPSALAVEAGSPLYAAIV